MKYLVAGLLVPSVQLLFLCAFALFGLGIAMGSLMEKIRPKKIPVRIYRHRR